LSAVCRVALVINSKQNTMVDGDGTPPRSIDFEFDWLSFGD